MSIVGMMALFLLHLSFLLVGWAVAPDECEVGWDCGSGLERIVDDGASDATPEDRGQGGFFIREWWQRITDAVGGAFENLGAIFNVVYGLATFNYNWLWSGESRLMQAVGWTVRIALTLVQVSFLLAVTRTILGRGR